MHSKSPREIALDILLKVEKSGEFSSNAIDKALKKHENLAQRDRAFITNIVQGVIRWKLKLDWIIENESSVSLKKINPLVLNILRIATYQILFLDRVPERAAVNEAVNTVKKSQPRYISSFVNGVLRSICRKKDHLSYPDRESQIVKFLSINYSYPIWLVKKWIEEIGPKHTEELLDAGNRIPSIYLRANTLRISPEELLDRLADYKIFGKICDFPPECISLDNYRGNLVETELFREGLFQIQERASQIVSHLLSPGPEDLILDLCAGSGIKSAHMLQIMNNKGRVIALDINQRKLKALIYNSDRLGIEGISPVQYDALRGLNKLFSDVKFDKILIDAPCSGLGTISRRPDIKWNRSLHNINILSEIQIKLLKEASLILKKGGTILYVTCTISKEENEKVIGRFLKENPWFSLVNLRDKTPTWCHALIDEYGFFKTYPHLHGMDGFFGALLISRYTTP